MQPKIIYSPEYDIRFLGIESLHPFDSCKYSRTWRELEKRFGQTTLARLVIKPTEPVTKSDLESIHSSRYLDSMERSLFSSINIAQALEIPLLGVLPLPILQIAILNPMKLAVSGTIIGAIEALKGAISVNLLGGYHHASKDHGEGFCIYSDIAIAISKLRSQNKLSPKDRIAIIDLDAHQGNGLERIFKSDSNAHFFDMYNQDIYPRDEFAKQRIDFNIPMPCGTEGNTYLKLLKEGLPVFINGIDSPKIAFYNAGTDVFQDDPLGKLNLTSEDILQRDVFVLETLVDAKIPVVMVLSGGYTRESYRIIADSVSHIIQSWTG